MGRYDGNTNQMVSKVVEVFDESAGVQRAGGSVAQISQVFKFGFQPSIGTTELPVWDVTAVYDYLTTAKTMTISSDAAAGTDDAAGTGARTVKITGQGDNGVEVSETLTMNSSVAVSTTRPYRRVYRMQVMTAGASATNTGNIYLGASTVTGGIPAEKYAMITTGEGQTLMALYTVPAGKTAFMVNFNLTQTGGGTGLATIRLLARPSGGAWNVKNKFTVNNNTVNTNLIDSPPPFAAGTDIEVRAKADTGTLPVSATFGLILKDV